MSKLDLIRKAEKFEDMLTVRSFVYEKVTLDDDEVIELIRLLTQMKRRLAD